MKLISKEVSRAEPEYMNLTPPISVLATALWKSLNFYVRARTCKKRITGKQP